MQQIILDVLPSALSVALSPMSIAAIILLFFGKNAKLRGLVFALGWLVGIVASVAIFSQIFSQAGDSDAKKASSAVIDIVLGILLLGLACREWISRPRSRSKNQPQPKWMRAIESISTLQALLMGMALSVVNSKNTILNISSAAEIGQHTNSLAEIMTSTLIYALIGSSTFILLAVTYSMFSSSMIRPLNAMKTWLTNYNSIILALLFVALGIKMLVKGLAMTL